MRPICHSRGQRLQAPIFRSVLACHAVLLVHAKLNRFGQSSPWAMMQFELNPWMRTTTILPHDRCTCFPLRNAKSPRYARNPITTPARSKQNFRNTVVLPPCRDTLSRDIAGTYVLFRGAVRRISASTRLPAASPKQQAVAHHGPLATPFHGKPLLAGSIHGIVHPTELRSEQAVRWCSIRRLH